MSERAPGSWRSFLLGLIAGVVLTILLAVAGIFGIVAAFKTEFVQQKAERLKPPPLAPDARADYNWSLVDIDGNEVPATTFEGRPWFLHFWSPSCAACEAEIPDLNQLHEAVRAESLGFAAVALGVDSADLAAEAGRLGITYPVYAVKGGVPEVFSVKAGPATFISDAAGGLIYKHIGAARWSDPSAEFYLKSLAQADGSD
ncbi:MAG: redoxin domain-containing protein [Candidatus Hydrogenedens sp.]|nr:redoxin domain-containing protein [Candidatus Hydrogenedens sp.]